MTIKTIAFSTITNYYSTYDDTEETQEEAIDRIIANSEGWDGEEVINDSIHEE